MGKGVFKRADIYRVIEKLAHSHPLSQPPKHCNFHVVFIKGSILNMVEYLFK